MNKLFQRMVSFALTGALCISMGATAFAAGNNNPLSSSETWTDEEGNSVKLVYSVEDSFAGADSHAALYVNGVLTQESYVSPKNDTVVEYDYSISATGETEKSNAQIKEYVYSDLVQNIITPVVEEPIIENEEGDVSTYVSVPFQKFDSEGWALVDRWGPASASPYAVSLYARNVDEEPDLHPFEKKQLNFAAKVAITTIAGVLGGFLVTGGITVALVVKAFGAAVIKEGTQYVINKAIKGTVCYSTQKIRYAPVVEGYNIYPKAYMTKLWLVAGNAYTGGKTYTLIQEAYEYDPQPSASDLMYAARHYFTDWAQQNGYGK